METSELLLAMYGDHVSSVPRYLWESEEDRWIELLACLLYRVSGLTMSSTRQLILIWRQFELTKPSTLKELEPGGDAHRLISFSLAQSGMAADQIDSSIAMLQSAARAVDSAYGGKIQVLLRKHAEATRDELATVLENSGLSCQSLKVAITNWLQNTTNAPLTLEDESVLRFCEHQGIGPKELESIADHLNLNLALMDDVIALDDASKPLLGKGEAP